MTDATSMTATRAKGKGLPPMSLMPEKICTEVTRVNSNINGTPSSVKAQMKTIVPPAKSPWHDQRKRDPSEFSKTGASEVFRGLFHGGIEVRERGDDVEVENG